MKKCKTRIYLIQSWHVINFSSLVDCEHPHIFWQNRCTRWISLSGLTFGSSSTTSDSIKSISSSVFILMCLLVQNDTYLRSLQPLLEMISFAYQLDSDPFSILFYFHVTYVIETTWERGSKLNNFLLRIQLFTHSSIIFWFSFKCLNICICARPLLHYISSG